MRYRDIAKNLLMGWGVISALIVIALGGMFVFEFFIGNNDSNETASINDVRYVLEWCGLGSNRIEEVLHSHISARSLTGDHLDVHAIRISHVKLSELTRDEHGGGWVRCDQASGVEDDAIKFLGMWLPSSDAQWFPSEQELRTSDYYLYPWSTTYYGSRPNAADLIFVRPKDKMVFFFGAKL